MQINKQTPHAPTHNDPNIPSTTNTDTENANSHDKIPEEKNDQ